MLLYLYMLRHDGPLCMGLFIWDVYSLLYLYKLRHEGPLSMGLSIWDVIPENESNLQLIQFAFHFQFY
jgi:hypothetical protein